MFTASTASVRPVKSTKSVTSRSTGRLTGTAGGSADATWGGPCWQPANAPTRSEHRIVETGNQRKESPCLHATVERLPRNDRRLIDVSFSIACGIRCNQAGQTDVLPARGGYSGLGIS